MAIYLIPFIICLIPALIPCIIQLSICVATDRLWLRMIPVTVSSLAMLIWAYLIIDGFIPTTPYLGHALDWIIWQSMLAALAIAHGLPFLILGQKK